MTPRGNFCTSCFHLAAACEWKLRSRVWCWQRCFLDLRSLLKPEELIGLGSSCSLLSHLIKSSILINQILISCSQHENTTGLHVRKKDSCGYPGTKSRNIFSPFAFIMVFDAGSSYNHFTPQIMSRHGAHFHLEIKCKLAKRGVLQKHMHIDFSFISTALLGDTLKSHQGEKKRERKTTICYAYSLW